MQVLGFDFGMHYIGVATGQSITNTATPLTTLIAKDGVPNWAMVEKLLHEWKPQLLIVGLPKNLDGSMQDVGFAANKFAKKLRHRFKLPVMQQEEAYTTKQARQLIDDSSDYLKLNAISAALITENWLKENSIR